MSEIRRTGSEDQVFGSYAAGDHDTSAEDEAIIACDSGLSELCSGVATITRAVPYLREPMRLCTACDRYETLRQECGPSDDPDAWAGGFAENH